MEQGHSVLIRYLRYRNEKDPVKKQRYRAGLMLDNAIDYWRPDAWK